MAASTLHPNYKTHKVAVPGPLARRILLRATGLMIRLGQLAAPDPDRTYYEELMAATRDQRASRGRPDQGVGPGILPHLPRLPPSPAPAGSAPREAPANPLPTETSVPPCRVRDRSYPGSYNVPLDLLREHRDELARTSARTSSWSAALVPVPPRPNTHWARPGYPACASLTAA